MEPIYKTHPELVKKFKRKCEALTGRKAYSSRSINKGRTYRVSIPFGPAYYIPLKEVKNMAVHESRADTILNLLEQEMDSNVFISYKFHVGASLYISWRLDVRE